MDKDDALMGIESYCHKVLDKQSPITRTDMQIILDYVESTKNNHTNKLQIQLDMALEEIHVLNQKIFKLKSNVENVINNL